MTTKPDGKNTTGARAASDAPLFHAASGSVRLAASAPAGGSYFIGAYWRVSLLKDGRMGASQSRAGLIRLALGR